MAWEQSGDRFLESDVVKWTEAIWPTRKTRKRARPWGEQEVTAQIIDQDGDYIELKVLKAVISQNHIGSDLRPYKVGTIFKKKRQTILRGKPERLRWSEEDVRAALTKEFYDRI